MQIRLGIVASASLLVTVASLTALVIVVAIRGADLLSVVALALAIIAFSAQLIIYIVQASESAASSRRALELHTQISALLSELRERTGRTQHSVDTINARLLEAVIGKTEIAAGSESPRLLAEQIAETYTEASRTTPSIPDAGPLDHLFPPALPREQAEELHAYLSLWPGEEETPRIVERLGRLRPSDLMHFARFSRDAWSSTKPGAPWAPGLSVLSEALLREGLIEKVPGWTLYTLTREGRDLARAFTATGNTPEWAQQLVELRKKAPRLSPRPRRDAS